MNTDRRRIYFVKKIAKTVVLWDEYFELIYNWTHSSSGTRTSSRMVRRSPYKIVVTVF